MPTEKPRYTITLDEEMLKKIDDFRFENRFPNRTQATLELIRIGMEALEKQQEEQKKAQKNKPSTKCYYTNTSDPLLLWFKICSYLLLKYRKIPSLCGFS